MLTAVWSNPTDPAGSGDLLEPSRQRKAKRNAWILRGLILVGIAGLLAGLDWYVGQEQQRLLEARRAHRAKLDHLAFHGVRTGIDRIGYQLESVYSMEFRIQNATADPIFVMLPAVEAFVHVGAGWMPAAVVEPQGRADEGSVMKLVGERPFMRLATLDTIGYMELIPGYMHVKLSLEAYVSPEENPQEEIGERREEIFIYVKDYRLTEAEVRARGDSLWAQKPSFIPLRAWTLIPTTSD